MAAAARRLSLLGLGSVLLLAGCVAKDAVAVGPSDRPGVPRAYVTLCRHETVKSVRLELAGPDEVMPEDGSTMLWQIDADPGQRISLITVGDTPPGFTVDAPLQLPLPANGKFVLTVESGVQGIEYFRLTDLQPGKVVSEGSSVSFEKFRHDAYYGGKCEDDLAVPLTIGAAFGVSALAAVGIGSIFWQRNARRRRMPASQTDPWASPTR
jgi:hypothetical protein